MRINTTFLKVISILCYCVIILGGWFIGIPFIVFLFMALADDEVFTKAAAFAAIAGLFLTVSIHSLAKTKKIMLFEITAFLLLPAPLLQRLLTVPINLFNHPEFIIPAAAFIVFHLLFLFDLYRNITSAGAKK
jgi:hypothetical protein